ncbi:16S rRNA (adenine(1518)-N(6)/adenine(1519)-N(6))-dimethyltransferase RsmA [Iodidimonas sp. SYSU 1G8]|uniref:16S rRNA (adenine(1518)-N(6)/adenine(1519)-N(6))- dimethyltransferase RsmA n=1 Tax=Iodidimonas sp. SYSU 1G8 TaxID=3133967 RepID=UPI0031FEC5E5
MTLPPLRDVIARHGLAARKSLGQNFLLDLNLTARIARGAGVGPASQVYEVGPGPGGLTRALLEAGARVVAVEKDDRCVEALAEVQDAYPGRLTVVSADALDVDERTLLPEGGPVQVVANLPYNVSTVLLAKWLTVAEWPSWYAGLTLMFQREVADRITAPSGGKAYGRLSVLSQWRTAPRRLFDIPPSAFVPQPKITSTVVHFAVLPQPVAEAELSDLKRVIDAAFNQRRKMLRSSLKGVGIDTEILLADAGIEPTLRAETLNVAQFCAIARSLNRLRAAG